MAIKKPTKFHFTGITVKPAKGLKIEWSDSRTDGPSKSFDDLAKGSDSIPHPDFSSQLTGLKKFILSCFDFDSFLEVDTSDPDLKDSEKKALKALKSMFEKHFKSKLEDLEITKVSVNVYNDKDKKSVQIFAKHYTVGQSGKRQPTPIKTPKIALHESEYGFEEELATAILKINQEAEAYVFDNKNASPEIAFPTNKDEAA